MSHENLPVDISSVNDIVVTIPGGSTGMPQGGVLTIPSGSPPIQLDPVGDSFTISFPMAGENPPIQVTPLDGGLSVSVPTAGGSPPIQLDPVGDGVTVSFPIPAGSAPLQVGGSADNVSISFPISSPPVQLEAGNDGSVVVHVPANRRLRSLTRLDSALVVEVPPAAGAVEWTVSPSGKLTLRFPTGARVRPGVPPPD